MSDKFTVEIISPNQSILKLETTEVTIPSYEGQMGILKDHIPLITFLRPGIISIQDQEKNYYIEEGTVEFSNNNLLILTSKARELTDLDQSSIKNLLNIAESKLNDINSSDKEKYTSSYKISTLKEINQ
jgi:F-type H+-transporting ATPase subunit epsilon/F-type H+-transporting ATPase subunit delta|tara:strand:- start:186 stop:572 length:387 start_codon:yes stop_codon:yes gene_type:complete